MIQPNELRIGNWVNLIKLQPIQITADHIKSIAEGDRDYSEILLTEEWLLKLRFEIQNKLNIQGGTNTWFKEGVNEYLSFHYDGFVVYESTKKIIIKSVHQLQNLYFALTGQELELKEYPKDTPY